MHPSTDIAVTTPAPDKAGAGVGVREKEAATNKDIKPELILTAPSKADRSEPAKLFGVSFPEGISNFFYDLSDFGSRARFHTLKVLPGFIVNHSSNAIGMTQLVGEALYFKSSGVGKFVKDEHRGTWKAFVYPPINVVEGVFKKSAFKIDYKQLLNPKHVLGEIRKFGDLEQATKVDFARDGKLSNRWSARSGFAGMTAMAIAAAFPDEKDDPEVTEKVALMATNKPITYVGYRLGRGLLFPVTAVTGLVKKIFEPNVDHHIGDGKREFSGIGMTLTGIFSVLAGFRQPRQLGNVMKYDFNKWQSLGGMITTFAGAQLLLSIDNQQGWTNYGKTQFLRLITLPPSIKERYPNKMGWGDPNAHFYLAAQGVFQSKNVVASLIGGAQKLPDGTIIDQKKVRAEAKDKALEAKREHRTTHHVEKSDTTPETPTPHTTVSHASAERAMPERVEVKEAVVA